MIVIDSLEELRDFENYRKFLRERLRRLSAEKEPCFVTKRRFDFELEGNGWKGYAILFGPKSHTASKRLRKGGLRFAEGHCRAEGRKLVVGGLPDKLVQGIQRTLARSKLGFEAVAEAGSEGGSESDGSVMVEGEAEVARQVPLGPVRFGGRTKGRLWAMTDPRGAIVRGGSGSHLKPLSQLNELGAWVLQAVADHAAREDQWRQGVALARKSAEKARSDLKVLKREGSRGETALGQAMERRLDESDFFGDVDGYLDAQERAEGLVGVIRKAEKDFDRATHQLDAALSAAAYHEVEKDLKDKQEELEQLERDIEQAKRIFGQVIGIVNQVRKQDWEGLATRVISQVATRSIEAKWAPEVAKLKEELASAKKQMRRLKTEELVSQIEAARAGLESAALAFENAREELDTALGQLARHRKNASHELKESSSTAVAGRLIAQRAQQLYAVTRTRQLCEAFLRDTRKGTQRLLQISRQYSLVGSRLDRTARSEPAYARGTMLRKTLEQSALSNAVLIDQWQTWLEKKVQPECAQALKWLTKDGPTAPMAPFDEAVELLERGLGGR